MKTKKWVLPVCVIAGVSVLCITALLAAAGIMEAKGFSKGNENDLPGNLGMGVDSNDGTESVLAAPFTQSEPVRFGRGYANISLSIPDGWEYETEVWTDSVDFSVSFWPAGRPEGKIRVCYYDSFGVCGTFLEQEKIKLGNYEARKGTYDGHKVWDFISLIGTPGRYVIENEGATKWWDEYGGEAMGILNTLVVGDGIISEAEAVAIAEKEATVAYNKTWTSYDSENGLWTVTFGKQYPGGDQTITITCEGKVTGIQYGE